MRVKNTRPNGGSTLTEPETARILFDNVALPNRNIIEHLEVKNHQAAWRYLLDYLMRKQRVLDQNLVLKLHSILMNGIQDDAGLYRRHAVRIVGANVPTANYLKIPELMAHLEQKIQASPTDTTEHIANIHARFEQIPPFSDGNGRIGRLLIHAMALKKNFPPALILQEKKQLYYRYLQKAQQKGDQSLLEDFLCDAFLENFRILEGV